MGATGITLADLPNIFIMIGALVALFAMLVILLRNMEFIGIVGEGRHHDAWRHAMQPPRLLMQRVHIPFTFKLEENQSIGYSDNGISLELMKCLSSGSEELKELIPNIRERILFKSGLEKLLKILNETYYIPGVKYSNKYRPAKGKLIDRYNNQRRLLKREGVLGRKRKLEIENIQEHSDIEEDEDTVIWLQYNKEPFHEVKDKWLETRKYRMEADYKNAKHNLQDILKKYPLLKQSFGFQLIELDFEYRHPKRDISLFVKFPQFVEKANDAFIDVKVFQDLKIVFNSTTKEGISSFVSSTVRYYHASWWGAPVRELHATLWGSLPDILASPNLSFTRSNPHDERALHLSSDEPLQLGPPPRTCYPLVVILARDPRDTAELRPDDTVALVSVVHIRDDQCPLPSGIIAQYLKQANGHLSCLKQLYVTGEQCDEAERYAGAESALCCVCASAPLSRALLPCRHACLCAHCLPKLDKCPICRSAITSYFCIRNDEEPLSELKQQRFPFNRRLFNLFHYH